MRKTVHSKIITTPHKSYLFDIKQVGRGKSFLSITELVADQKGDKDINQIIISKDHYLQFIDTIDEMQRYL